MGEIPIISTTLRQGYGWPLAIFEPDIGQIQINMEGGVLRNSVLRVKEGLKCITFIYYNYQITLYIQDQRLILKKDLKNTKMDCVNQRKDIDQ